VSQNLTWHTGNVNREERQRLLGQKGVTLWFTGLSAAGKSTIACLVEKKLFERGRLAYRLDGDNIRHGLNNNLGFSANDRHENIRRIGEVAKLFVDSGIICLASFISPYRTDRDRVRTMHIAGDFLEIYVKVSLAKAEQRDPKGLYKKARTGQITGFTGIDDPYEEPLQPEILIDTEILSAEQAAEHIVNFLDKHHYLVHK
jgi:adenylylsulfate kinase